MKRWAVITALGLALLLGAPLVWWLGRPSVSAGIPIDQVLTEPAPSAPASPGNAPAVGTRPADITAPTGAEAEVPRQLRIASVGVDAAIDPVGVESDGSMVIPQSTERVGWYRFGPAPGSTQGAAVIAGHVDSRAQGQGALFRLRDASPGDIVEVDTGGGTTLRYRVLSRERIVKKALPTERLFTRVGPPVLVLITCGGPFDQALRSYEDNLVVLAEPMT